MAGMVVMEFMSRLPRALNLSFIFLFFELVNSNKNLLKNPISKLSCLLFWRNCFKFLSRNK